MSSQLLFGNVNPRQKNINSNIGINMDVISFVVTLTLAADLIAVQFGIFSISIKI